MKILLIDNYDSFTYNLVHLFAQINDVEVDVVRNDAINLKNIIKYDGIIIGPGPGSPSDPNYFGDNMQVIKICARHKLPLLGVCLGFQGIALAYKAHLKKAKLPQHGKTSRLFILDDQILFKAVPQNVEVMRYHSLMIDTDKPLPDELIITSEVRSSNETVKANGREIMSFRHKALPIYGVQFHPESFATELGDKMAENFITSIQRQP